MKHFTVQYTSGANQLYLFIDTNHRLTLGEMSNTSRNGALRARAVRTRLNESKRCKKCQ